MKSLLLRIAFLGMEVWTWLIRPISLGVRIILVMDGEVLLVRHTYTSGWHFPGGYMNRGETPVEAAAREAKEEAGVELLELPALVGIHSTFGGGKSDHVAVYLCRKFRTGQATDSWEIAECKRFALDALPLQLNSSARKLLSDLKLVETQ